MYELLGPFSIGKGEVDGDPLEAPALGGIGALPLGKGSYHSEYAGERVRTYLFIFLICQSVGLSVFPHCIEVSG